MLLRTLADRGATLAQAWFVGVLAILLVLPAFPPAPSILAAGPIIAIVAVGAAGRRVGVWTILGLAVAGIGLRVACAGVQYSDVLAVTSAAIGRIAAGLNPYGVGYETSLPPGATFPYGPLALAWYVPAIWAPRLLELAVSAGILVALAVRGRPLGLAVYALAPVLFLASTDGSNDTSAGLLLLVALVVMRRSPLLGGFALAAAIAFKPYAAAWAPAFVIWSGWTGWLALCVGSVALWTPALLAWGAGPIADSLTRATRMHELGEPSRSLARVILDITGVGAAPVMFDRLRFVAGAFVAAAELPRVRSSRVVILAGLVVFLVVMYGGYWSSVAYLSAIAPTVCWYLDEWLGLDHLRVALPGDPARRIETRIARLLPMREHTLPPLGVRVG